MAVAKNYRQLSYQPQLLSVWRVANNDQQLWTATTKAVTDFANDKNCIHHPTCLTSPDRPETCTGTQITPIPHKCHFHPRLSASIFHSIPVRLRKNQFHPAHPRNHDFPSPDHPSIFTVIIIFLYVAHLKNLSLHNKNHTSHDGHQHTFLVCYWIGKADFLAHAIGIRRISQWRGL